MAKAARYLRAGFFVTAYWFMWPAYKLADKFARWFEIWDINTFGW